jgi:succinyl-CoA synthetase alpha subunit
VPVHDILFMRRLAAERGVCIWGPSSVGYLQFPRLRLGYLGGQTPFATLTEGGIAVASCSGGMTNETLMALARNGIGIRLALSVGGDTVNGCTLAEALHAADAHSGVTQLAAFIEPGNPLLRALIGGKVAFAKPLVICLPGDALERLPRGMPYGHAGTVLGEEEGSLTDIRRALNERGIRCTARHDEFVEWCRTT